MCDITIDQVRDYWNRRPCNIRHSRQVIGTRIYFDEVEARKYMVEPHIPGFAEFAKWEGKSVLEIGCGIGTDAVNFARAGARYTGVELSSESLNLAKQRFDIFRLTGEFFLCDGEDLPEILFSRQFDLIYSFGVLHHTLNPRNVVKRIRDLMHNKSEFRLMLYAKNSWKNIMIENGFDQPEAQQGCPIAYTYTEKDIEMLLAGYKITEIRQDHIFPFVVEDYINYKYKLQPWFECMPNEMFRALEKKLGWHMLITCQLAR